VQLHDRGEGSPSLLATASDAKARAPGRSIRDENPVMGH
jgi:hypothetical protein